MWLSRNKLNVNVLFLLMAVITVHLVWSQDLPDEVELPEINEDELKKTAEEGKKALKEKCLKVSGSEDAFNELEGAKDKLLECGQNIVNVTAFQTELDDAKKRGAMEEVFGKYCKKKPELIECVNVFKGSLEKCMEDKEKATLKIVMNITESLLDFMCYKDGDRVAMFIAEGGFQCIDSKKTEIQKCANDTFSDLVPKDMNIANMGGLLIIDSDKCDNFTKLQQCVTKELENCGNNKTPANVVESLFKYIKKSLPCTTPPSGNGEPQLFEYNRIKRQSILGNGLEEKCRINTKGDFAYQELNATFRNFWECFKSTALKGDPNKCPDITRTTELCAAEIYPKLQRCLLPKEDFFIDFIRDALKAVLEFGCKDNGKNLRDFMLDEGLKCISNAESSHNFKACLQRGDRHKREGDQMVIEKKTLCDDIGNVKMCTVEHIKHSKCADYKRFTELVNGFMDSVQSPCAASSMFVNLMLLFGVLYYHLQNYFY